MATPRSPLSPWHLSATQTSSAKKSGTTRLHFICAHDHPLARLASPTAGNDIAEFPSDIAGAKHLHWTHRTKAYFKAENIPLKSTMSTNYLETISTMVEVGLGWSVLPETLAKQLHVMPFNHAEMHTGARIYLPHQTNAIQCRQGLYSTA